MNTDIEMRPQWCVCCDAEEAEGTERHQGVHAGNEKEILLSLEEPWHGRDPMTGQEIWTPARLSISLALDLDAIEPFYGFEVKGSAFEMRGEEIDELVSVLIGLRVDTQREQGSTPER